MQNRIISTVVALYIFFSFDTCTHMRKHRTHSACTNIPKNMHMHPKMNAYAILALSAFAVAGIRFGASRRIVRCFRMDGTHARPQPINSDTNFPPLAGERESDD